MIGNPDDIFENALAPRNETNNQVASTRVETVEVTPGNLFDSNQLKTFDPGGFVTANTEESEDDLKNMWI